MKIKIEEDLPKAVLEIIRKEIPETLSVVEERLSGILDPDLWEVVQEEGRFLITSDKGFANIRQYPPGTHHGVLLLRPDDPGVPALRKLVHEVLAIGRLESLAGCTAVAAPGRLKVRRPPKGSGDSR